MVSRRAQGSHCSSLTGWLLRLFGRLSLILFVPIANAGYNLRSGDVTLTQDASDTTSPYNYTITFTINNVTGGKNQNDGIESMQLVLDDGSSYCNSGISIAPADVNTSTTYGPFNATAFTNNSSDASLPAGSYSSIQLVLFTDDNCGTQETFANNLALTITAPNSPPVAVDDTGAVDENSTLNVAASGLLGNDTDADADALSITAIRTGTEAGSGSAGTLSSSLTGTYGDLTLNADGSYSYNANNSESLSAGTTTTDTFTYTISDGAATDTGQLVITITGVNDPPVLTGDLAAPIDEGGTYNLTTTDLFYTDSDDDNAGVTFTVSSLDSALTLTVNGSAASTFTGTQLAAGQVTFTHDGAEGDTVTFAVNVEDGNEDSSAPSNSTFTFTITDVNDPPVLTGDLAAPIDEGGTYNLTTTDLFYTDSDDDNAGVTFTVSSLDSALTLTVNGSAASTFTGTQLAAGQVTFTHDGAEGDTVTFAVNVEDGNEDSSAPSNSTFTFTITDVNDPPVLTGDLAAPIDEGGTYNLTTTDLFYTDSDDDNAGVTFTVSSLDSALTLTVNGSAASTFTGTQLAAGQVTFTHDGAEGDTVTFAVNVEDGNEDSSAPSNSTFTFTITDVNDPPVLTGDLAAPIDEGGTYNLTTTDLFYTDSDDDNAGVTFTVSSLDSALTLTVNGSAASTFTGTQLAAGQVTFTHDGAEGDTVTFAVNVEDGNEDSSAPSNSTFTFTVVEVAPSLDHYAISLSSNSASTCGVLAITVTAHNASDGEVATDHNVTLGVSISGPTWNETGSGTIGLTFNGNSVSANLISSAAISNLQVTLTDTTNNAIGIRGSESPTFAFTNAGSSLSFTGPGNLTAGLNNTAPTATIAVTTPADCTAAGTGTLSTAFYFGCLDPTSCVDGQDLTINNQAVSSSSGSPTSVSLGFTNGTSAPFEVNYEDVGQVQLAAAVTIAATGDNPAHTVTGSTTFVSKPADFILALDSNSASGGFKAAGEAFTIGTTATNLDGNTTPNYGAEATPETLTASFVSLVAPSDGANGSLSPGTYTHAGSGVGSLAGVTYSETGTINLQVGTDSDYLGTGSQINSSAVTTGRFYPSYFTLGSNQVIDSCSSGNFTYQGTGASVSYIVTAKNAADVTTSNYTNGASNLASFSLVAEAVADDGSDYTTRLTQSASSSWNAGVYTLSNTTVAFSRSATPESSYSVDIGLKAIDTSDSVNFSSLDMNAAASGCGAACDAIDLSGNPKLRWGRLSLSSASGSEYQSLPLPLVTEYYNGSSFITNTDDGCTTIARSKIEFNNVPISPPSDLTVDIGSGSNNSAGSSSNVDLTSTDLVLVTGDGNLVFSAPSDNDRGSFTVDVDLTDLPWLKYDWDLDGSHDDSPPTATGTFGVFGGHDKILFRKPSN